MQGEMVSDFYTSQQDKLLGRFDQRAKLLGSVLAPRYGDEPTDALIAEARRGFDALISKLPYIGAKNTFLSNLIESAMCLALHRALKNHGASAEAAGAASGSARPR